MSTITDYRMHELRHWDWDGISSGRTPSGVRVNADSSMACSAYTACIRVISDAVSSLPLHLFEKLPNGGKRKVSDNPLYRVLHTQPNPWQTAQEFRDWMTGLYLHYGASYAEIRTTAPGRLSTRAQGATAPRQRASDGNQGTNKKKGSNIMWKSRI